MTTRRHARWRTLIAAAALTLAPAASWSQGVVNSNIGRLVRLSDGRRINLRCSGSGAPTILFEGGFAADSQAWWKVQPRIAAKWTACSYDRAGYGASDPGPEPRDGAAVVKDLDETLRRARVRGPFVVVGHSAGALYLRLFAARRPRDVIGMVLVDPSIEHQDRRFEQVFGPGAGSLKGAHDRAVLCLAAARRGVLPSTDSKLTGCGKTTNAANWQTQISEADTLWAGTSDEVAAAPLPDRGIPLIVLTAGANYANAPPQARAYALSIWTQLHQEIASLSSVGQERLVPGSSHMIMLDRPEAVVSAIEETIAAATKRRGTTR